MRQQERRGGEKEREQETNAGGAVGAEQWVRDEEETNGDSAGAGGGTEKLATRLQQFSEQLEKWLGAHRQLGEEQEVKRVRQLRGSCDLMSEVIDARSALEVRRR
eukprot:514919-Hanusia_phi.AAC.1